MLTATIVGLASYHPAVARPEMDVERSIVKDDPGGSVNEFLQSLDYIERTGMKIKVDGYCASACTLLLTKKIDFCVTKNARFGFHQPFAANQLGQIYYRIPFVVGAEKIWKIEFYGKYPAWVQKMIDSNGGVPSVYRGYKPSDMFWIEFENLKKEIKVCL